MKRYGLFSNIILFKFTKYWQIIRYNKVFDFFCSLVSLATSCHLCQISANIKIYYLVTEYLAHEATNETNGYAVLCTTGQCRTTLHAQLQGTSPCLCLLTVYAMTATMALVPSG